jgi:hypothetical protein
VTAPSPRRPAGTSVQVARPLFQVLRDDSQLCICHAHADGRVCSSIAMHVTAADYNREGAVFL